MTYRRALFAGFCTAALLGVAWGCSAADSSTGSFSGGGGEKGIPDGGNDEQLLATDGSMGEAGGGIVLNVLCGKRHTCVPDSPPNTCDTFTPPVIPTQGTSSGGATNEPAEVDASDDGGIAGASGPSSSADGGSAGAAGASGASSDAGIGASAGAGAGAGGMSGEGGGAAAPPADTTMYGCQVQRTTDDPKVVTSQCGVVGSGGDNAPCLTSADCKAGFGCVGDQNAGLCQAYCCESADNCRQGKYCAERPLRDAFVNALPKGSSSAALSIPVCVPAENCDLGAPYPCTAGTQCACKSGTACLVVRSDGTTTCAVPGAGKVGDPCPCAWGHVCSAATSQCLQLCYTPGAASCGDGKCQSASELPNGWGVCVGGTPSAG